VKPAARFAVTGQIINDFIVTHPRKIDNGFTTALAVPTAFRGRHMVPILCAGLGDVKVFDLNHLETIFYNDAYSHTIP
jgi:hypothetical protein